MKTDYFGLYDPDTLICTIPETEPAQLALAAFGPEILLTMANEAASASDEFMVQTDRFGRTLSQNYILEATIIDYNN